MKAVVTRYLPFTNTKPARIKASAEGVPSIIASVESFRLAGNGLDDPHITAAKALCRKYDWGETLASGVLPGGDWCHCFIPDVVPATLQLADTLLDTVSCSERFDGLRDSVKASIKALALKYGW